MTIAIEIIDSASHDLFAGAVSLLQRFFEEEEFETEPGLIAQRTAKMATSKSHWLAVGLFSHELAGVATASLLFTIEMGDIVELADLYVVPSFRGHGVAHCLMKTAAQWALSHDARAVEVVVTPRAEKRHSLNRFYAKHGFENTSRVILVRDLSRV